MTLLSSFEIELARSRTGSKDPIEVGSRVQMWGDVSSKLSPLPCSIIPGIDYCCGPSRIPVQVRLDEPQFLIQPARDLGEQVGGVGVTKFDGSVD